MVCCVWVSLAFCRQSQRSGWRGKDYDPVVLAGLDKVIMDNRSNREMELEQELRQVLEALEGSERRAAQAIERLTVEVRRLGAQVAAEARRAAEADAALQVAECRMHDEVAALEDRLSAAMRNASHSPRAGRPPMEEVVNVPSYASFPPKTSLSLKLSPEFRDLSIRQLSAFYEDVKHELCNYCVAKDRLDSLDVIGRQATDPDDNEKIMKVVCYRATLYRRLRDLARHGLASYLNTIEDSTDNAVRQRIEQLENEVAANGTAILERVRVKLATSPAIDISDSDLAHERTSLSRQCERISGMEGYDANTGAGPNGFGIIPSRSFSHVDLLQRPELWGISVAQLVEFHRKTWDGLCGYCADHGLDKDFVHVCLRENCGHHQERRLDVLTRPVVVDEIESVDLMPTDMYAVVNVSVKPMTRDANLSYALMINEGGNAANVFVSHCWLEDFNDLVSTLRAALRDNDVGWICSFALNQNVDLKEQFHMSLEQCPFAVALRSASRVILSCGTNAHVPKRAWCIYELYLAWKHGVPCHVWVPPARLSAGLLAEVRAAAAAPLELRDCAAGDPADLTRIMDAIGAANLSDVSRRLRRALDEHLTLYADAPDGRNPELVLEIERLQEARATGDWVTVSEIATYIAVRIRKHCLRLELNWLRREGQRLDGPFVAVESKASMIATVQKEEELAAATHIVSSAGCASPPCERDMRTLLGSALQEAPPSMLFTPRNAAVANVGMFDVLRALPGMEFLDGAGVKDFGAGDTGIVQRFYVEEQTGTMAFSVLWELSGRVTLLPRESWRWFRVISKREPSVAGEDVEPQRFAFLDKEDVIHFNDGEIGRMTKGEGEACFNVLWELGHMMSIMQVFAPA